MSYHGNHSTVTEFTKRCGLLPLKDLTIPNYLPNSFNRDGLLYDVWKPHLVFEHVITTIHFNKKVNDKVLTKQILKGFKDFRVEMREI